ncbi:MAG: phosphate/phosphite/phosphonate ABC transporter substrate-binding protein [Bdellovibrionota bacterium]
MRFFLLLLCLSSPAFAAASSSALVPITELTIGFNPAENAELVEMNGKAFSEYFKKQMGLSVKTFVATDYIALVEALRSGKIDFAFLPPFSLIKAEQIANAQVLMKAVRKGKSVFYSAIIVRADKGYNKVEDLKGKNIAWVDPASASGFIYPKAMLLLKKKIDADTFFKRQIFAGAHDAVVLSVLNGTVDAGATFVNDTEGTDGAWHLFLKTDADRKKIKMIFVSDPIPGETISTSKKFAKENKAIVDQFVKILGAMGSNKEGRDILMALYRIESMIPATSQEFQPVRDAAKAIHIE